MIRPTTIPQSLEELKIEQAIAREALRLAFVQHKEFAVNLQGVQKERTIADAFSQDQGNSLVNMMKLDLLVGSGGVLSHAPRRTQSMMMMIDAFQVEGVTELAVDSIFMMPHLGVLSTVHPEAATEVFLKDCLIRLGTCVAPVGHVKKGALCHIELELPGGGSLSKALQVGELHHVELAEGETAKAVITPARGVDLGCGPGEKLERSLRGGSCGLVFDGRGRRPFRVPEEAKARVLAASRWSDEMQLYPAG